MMDSKLSEKETTAVSAATAFADVVEKSKSAVDWKGTLADGAFVSYIESEDLAHAVLSIWPAGSNAKKTWMGTLTIADENGDVKTTITDDTNEESIVIVWSMPDKDGTTDVDIEGYGKGALTPLSVEDYLKTAEALKSLSNQ